MRLFLLVRKSIFNKETDIHDNYFLTLYNSTWKIFKFFSLPLTLN